MIDNMLWRVYVSNISTIIIAIPVLLLIWSAVGALFYKRMRVIGTVFVVFSVLIIVYITAASRETSKAGLELIPFSSFERAKIQPEFYRSMLMNVFLFVPFGLTFPFVFGGSTAKRIWLTILIGFLLSVTIEVIQYFFSLGLLETDDVICNTLGTAIGACAYPLSLLWRRIPKNIKTLDKVRRKDENA